MELIRNTETKELMLIDGDKKLFSMNFFFDEFIWTFYSNKPIIITKSIDETFFSNLDLIMNSEYIFNNNGLSLKQDNKLIWLSDQYGNFEDKSMTDRINRLIIEKENDAYKIYTFNPLFSELNINKSHITIIFSPSGNGYYTQNKKTGKTFQDDIITYLYWKSFEDSKIKYL